MSLLRLDKVSLNFGTHILLDEVDFQIAKGQRIGLLGRNGAGKTTLMRIVADLPSLMGVNAGFGLVRMLPGWSSPYRKQAVRPVTTWWPTGCLMSATY